MNDCNDTDGPPAGTFERSIQDLKDVEATLSAEAETNRQKQSDAEEASPELRRQFPVPNEEYIPEPFLIVPYSAAGKGRPIDRRPDADPPLNSVGLEVSVEGAPVTTLRPTLTHTIECTVRNAGGLAAGNTYVELFVEYKTRSATLDVNPETNRVQVPRSSAEEITLSGYTTLSPGSEVSIVGYMDVESYEGDGLPRDSLLYVIRDIEVTEDDNRVFETTISGKPEEFWGGFEIPDDRSEFTFRVVDTTDTTSSSVSRVWHSPLLAEQSASFVGTPTNEKRSLDLHNTVDSGETERIGKTKVDVPSSDTTTVSFKYTPSSSADDRSLSVFYARAYTLASSDTPEEWGGLNHTQSRFVGRRELPWQDE